MPVVVLFLLLIFAAPGLAQPAILPATSPDTMSAGETEIDALIHILEDDKARGRLIEMLRAEAGQAVTPSRAPAKTLVHTIMDPIGEAVEGTADLMDMLAALGDQLYGVFSGTATVDLQGMWDTVRALGLVVLVTFATYLALRFAFLRVRRRLAEAAKDSAVIRRIGIIALAAAAEALSVVGAWAAGHVSAYYLEFGGDAGPSRALFLEAFFFIELLKVAARVLLAPRWPALRIGMLDDTATAYWYFWLSRLGSVVGYTFFLIAPILELNVSAGAAEALRVFALFCTLNMACIIILQNRDKVRAWLLRRGKRGQAEPLVRALLTLARLWHVVAIGYLVLTFILWVTNRGAAFPFVLFATAQTILALAAGLALTFVAVRLVSGGMHLPADVRERLPLLEKRLNAYVPAVLRVVRIFFMVAVTLAIAQIWRVANLVGWLSSEFGQRVVTSLIAAAITLLVGGLVYLAVQSWVEYRLDPPNGRKPGARERTLLGLFRNAFNIALGLLVFMLILAELGVDIGPLLAGAGIVGLAAGFGAQKLVQDIINGIFIQFENALNVGDVVTLGAITGTVERLTIRSVSLRSVDGAYHVIPFSSVEAVTNFTHDFSYHIAAIGVNYSERIPVVKDAILEAFQRLKETEFGEHIIGDIEMHGVTEFGDSAIMLRARIMTRPGQQFALGRAYNEIIKEVFDERGIEIPFPHLTVQLPENKTPRLAPAETDMQRKAPSKRDKGRKRATPRRASERRRKVLYDVPNSEGPDAADDAPSR